jgi:hypothetical protein
LFSAELHAVSRLKKLIVWRNQSFLKRIEYGWRQWHLGRNPGARCATGRLADQDATQQERQELSSWAFRTIDRTEHLLDPLPLTVWKNALARLMADINYCVYNNNWRVSAQLGARAESRLGNHKIQQLPHKFMS